MDQAEAQLEAFLGRYLPGVAAIGRGAVRQLRTRLPGCDVLVYDNYQALAVGFSPDGKTGNAFLSVALYPRWVNLFFLQGAGLPDRESVLQGAGSIVRHVRLSGVGDLDLPHIRTLIDAAIAGAPVPYDPGRSGQLVIKSISAKQKPRRPA
ncbi:MAG: hypothetical protein ACKOQM_11685 [Novosphingobium sp.]